MTRSLGSRDPQGKERVRALFIKAARARGIGLQAMRTVFQKSFNPEPELVKYDTVGVLLIQWESSANDMPGLNEEVSLAPTFSSLVWDDNHQRLAISKLIY